RRREAGRALHVRGAGEVLRQALRHARPRGCERRFLRRLRAFARARLGYEEAAGASRARTARRVDQHPGAVSALHPPGRSKLSMSTNGGQRIFQTPPTEFSKEARPLPTGSADENPKDIGFLSLLAEDFRTYERNPLDLCFWTVAIHRFGNWRMRHPKVV